jgi:hypothetical protein
MTNVRVLLVIKDIRRWGERVFVGPWSFNGKKYKYKTQVWRLYFNEK